MTVRTTNYPDTEQRDCKLCGRPILIARTIGGARLALDLETTCWIIQEQEVLTPDGKGKEVRNRAMCVLAYADHADLCGRRRPDVEPSTPGST